MNKIDLKISLFLVLIFLIGTSILVGVKNKKYNDLNAKYEALLNAPKDTMRIETIDTLWIDKPIPVASRMSQDTVYIKDTVYLGDSIKAIEIVLPREEKVYKSDSYRAVISGIDPSLDSIQVYNKTVKEVITKHITHTKYKRFGVGVGVGASYDGRKVRPAVTIGVQYNIVSF